MITSPQGFQKTTCSWEWDHWEWISGKVTTQGDPQVEALLQPSQPAPGFHPSLSMPHTRIPPRLLTQAQMCHLFIEDIMCTPTKGSSDVDVL